MNFKSSKIILEVSTIIKNDLKQPTSNEIQYICNGENQKLLDFGSNECPELNKFEPYFFIIIKQCIIIEKD